MNKLMTSFEVNSLEFYSVSSCLWKGGLTLFLICTIIWVGYAQQDLPSEQVEVIKDFDARIDQAHIIQLQPIIPPRDTSQKIINQYELTPSDLVLTYDPPKIKPLAIPQEKQPDYYPLFLKAGYGTPNSPYASGSYHWFNQENIDVHVHGHYHGAHKKDLEHQKFSEFNSGFSTRYITQAGAAIKGGINYRADNNYLYGYDHELFSFTDSLASRRITQLGLDLGVSNAFNTEANVDYYTKVRYNNLDDAHGYKESEIQLNGGLQKWITDKQGLGIDIEGLLIAPKDTSIDNLTNVQIQPYFNYLTGMFKIKAGLNAAKNDKFKIFPNIDVEANIAPGRLIAFAGWNGGLKSNSFASLYDVNPYISPDRTDLISTEYHEIYGGIKGAYKIINYEVKIGYEMVNYLPIYLTNSQDSRFLDAIYTDGNIFRFSAHLDAQVLNNVKVHADVLSNTYSIDNQAKAWHLPAFTFTMGGVVKSMKDKLRATIDISAESGVPVINREGEQDRLKALFDLSLGADYMVTKHIGAFAQANNIFNNKRERWIQYPSYGLNFKGGVIVRF